MHSKYIFVQLQHLVLESKWELSMLVVSNLLSYQGIKELKKNQKAHQTEYIFVNVPHCK